MLKLNPRIKNPSEFQAGAGVASHMFCLLVLRENKPVDFSRYFTPFRTVFSSVVCNITYSEMKFNPQILLAGYS